jgi:glycosyltransferase involved in cell wall biosynthesis
VVHQELAARHQGGGVKAFGWRADNAGCGWWRIGVPFAELESRGHTVGHSTTYGPEWDDADVIVGQRVCQPGPSARWQEWAKAGRRLVYDVDDDYWNVEITAPNGLFFGQRDVRNRIAFNAAAAARVTTCSAPLAELMSRWNADVQMVPNAVPAEVHAWPRPPRRERVTIGWAGTPSTISELPLAVRPLRRILERHPNVYVHTIGLPAKQIAAAGLRHERVSHAGPVADPMEYLRLASSFDIWVAPYRSTPFTRAKAATKAIEAAALGIPLIASSMGAYRQAVAHEETGLLVTADHEWETYLRLLIEDADLREQMGAEARARSVTAAAIAAQWEDALTDQKASVR